VRSEILEKHPDAKIAVYAVWFRNLWTDARFLRPSSALDDSRVVNLWDTEKVAGRWYAANVTRRGVTIEWDAWAFYATGKAFSDPSVDWGRTIVDTREQSRADIENLVHPPY
jgi:hypothetical protein